MSVEALALALHHSRAKGSAKLVLIGIANHDGDGGSYPATLTLAKYAGFEGWDAEPEDDTPEAKKAARKRRENAKKAAREAVRKLEALGEVEVITNGGVQGKPEHERTNLYRILLACPPECDRSAQHRLIPVDNSTEDPRGHSPAPGPQPRTPRGHSPAEPSLNHPPMGNSGTTARESHANDRESVSTDEASGYADWHPGQKIAEAARQAADAEQRHQPVKRPDLSRAGSSRSMVPPAVVPPRFDPASVPAKPPVQSPEQRAMNEAANRLQCPEGFGTGSGSRHLVPPTLTGCARCGEEAADIINGLELTA
ncbi:hypothetical protein [Leucobacter triazinivorans]|uniref:Uncharacterized protein n=1 Tax=Leucobacter triazinivorans TaxID=1784719 RepID=A0A4P6KEW6_9MICO|nr:hypothetical protein [Leucobacter triazinivorans]QBE48763.1 hypothetical protein EVS81_07890 [Leucobacter triazinivorans]